MKYRPDDPDRFGSLQEAMAFGVEFVRRPPQAAALPETVWINRTEQIIEPQSLLSNFAVGLSHPY